MDVVHCLTLILVLMTTHGSITSSQVPFHPHLLTIPRPSTQSRSLSHHPKTLPSARDKRLLGLFRCSGWGPGCSRGYRPVRPSPPEVVSSVAESVRPMLYSGRGRSSYTGPSRSLPFFAMSSGGSWGPSGKRSSDPWFPIKAPHRYPDSYRHGTG